MFYLIIATITVFDVLAVIFGKLWVETNNHYYFLATVLGFAITGGLFAWSLFFKDVAIANILWISASIIVVSIIGHFFWNELLSVKQIVGIGVILLGVVLVNW